MMARSLIAHSGRFSATSITRSPRFMPIAFSPAASADTCRAASAQLVDRHCPSRFTHRKGASPFSAARVKNIVTRLGKCSRVRMDSLLQAAARVFPRLP